MNKKRPTNFPLLCVFCLIALLIWGIVNTSETANNNRTLVQKLKQDQKNGIIDYDSYALYAIYAIKAPQKLPRVYSKFSTAQAAQRCGTTIMLEVRRNWQRLSSETQAKISRLLQRPTYTNEEFVRSSHFCVHYEDVFGGANLAYAQQVSNIAETVYDYFHDPDRYPAEPWKDGGEGIGPRNISFDRYDIYLRDISFFGQTTWEPSTNTSYMEVNTDWTGFRTQGEDAAAVTIAHEYFHAIQFEINDDADIWWMEASSTWVEDMIYDDINDFYGYLDDFLLWPHLPLYALNGGSNAEAGEHEYAASVFARFITDRLGTSKMEAIWDDHRTFDIAMDIIKNSLDTEPVYTFDSTFDSFLVANYIQDYSEDFWDDDARLPIPDVKVYETTAFSDFDEVVDRDRTFGELPRPLGANYLMVVPPTGNPYDHQYGDLKISFDGDDDTDWSFQIIKKSGSSFTTEKLVLSPDSQTALTTLHYFGKPFLHEVILVPAALSWIGAEFSYSYSLELDIDAQEPQEISDLTAILGSYRVTLSWSNPDDFDFAGVRVMRKTDTFPANIDDGIRVSEPLSPLSILVDNGVLDRDYYYTLFAFDGIPNYATGVTILASIPTDTTAPGVPASLTPSSVDENSITLSWTKPSDADLKGIAVFRDTASFPTTSGTKIYDANGSSYNDTSVISNTLYYYSVYAYDRATSTNYSTAAQVAVTVPADVNPPSQPQNLTRIPFNSFITLSWVAPPEIDFEAVRIAYDSTAYPSSPTDGIPVDVLKGTNTVNLSSLDNNTTYYFNVYSYDEIPNYSAPVQLTQQPDGEPPTINTVVLPNPIFQEYLDINIIGSETLFSLSASATFNSNTTQLTLATLQSLDFTYQGSYTLPQGSSGTISVSVNATDRAGNAASDTTAFAARVVLAKEGGTIKNGSDIGTLVIPANALDKDATVALLPVTQYTYDTPLSILGKGINVHCPKGNFLKPFTITFDYSGLRINASEEEKIGLYHFESGKWNFLSSDFTDKKISVQRSSKGAYALFIDQVAPLINLVTPSGRKRFKYKNPVISAQIDDIGAGVDPASIRVTVNNTSATVVTYDPDTQKMVARGFNVVEGPNTFVIEASDRVGNKATPLTMAANATGDVEFGDVFVYPNPAHSKATIRYETEKPSVNISLMIFDISGELVFHKDEIYRESREVEFLTYDYAWKCRNDRGIKVGSGIYIYRLEMTSGGKSDIHIGKMAVVR